MKHPKLTKKQYIETLGVVFASVRKDVAPLQRAERNKMRIAKSDKTGRKQKYKVRHEE